MGFSLKKTFNDFVDFHTGKMHLEKGKELLDGPKLPGWQYESPDPYSTNVQWDETGRPIGRMPRGNYALDYQYEADRRTDQRRQALWGDAQNALKQASGLLESYRPGGAAAIQSGIYSQQAGMAGQQAMSMQSPDLLMGYREHKQDLADYERKKAQDRADLMAVLGIGATVAGFAFGGPAGAAAAGAGMSQVGQGGQSRLNANTLQAMAGEGVNVAEGARVGAASGGVYQARLGDSGGIGAPGAGAGPSAPGGAPGAPGSAGGQAGPGPTAPGMKGGGPPTLQAFSSGEAAGTIMAQAPMPEEVFSRWNDSEDRRGFTYAMQQSSTERLAVAMAGPGSPRGNIMSQATRRV